MQDRLFDVPKEPAVDAGRKPRSFQPALTPARLTFKVDKKVWTERKATIAARYLHQFQMVTKHGVYIDGFAGMHHKPENWAASLVLKVEPPWLGPFYLIDSSRRKVKELQELKLEHPDREIHVVRGDSNKKIPEILASGVVSPTKATFALLDQFTFECHWDTVRALAAHPKYLYKIEIFCFLAQAWIDRSFEKLGDERGRLWWGNDDWKVAARMSGWDRAQLMTNRFRHELGYRHAHAWQIFGRSNVGALAYCMIHATDHDRAPKLMEAAYNEKVLPNIPTEQLF